MIAFGVPAGAIRPCQLPVLKPGNPDSLTVGTAGACGVRFSLDTAISRTEPLLACALASDKSENITGTWPATT